MLDADGCSRSQFVILNKTANSSRAKGNVEDAVTSRDRMLGRFDDWRSQIVASNMTTNADLARKLDALGKKYDAQFKVVFDAIRALMAPPGAHPAFPFPGRADGRLGLCSDRPVEVSSRRT